MVDPAHAGRGYATVIAAALLDLAFQELRLHSVKDAWHGELGWVDGYTYAILRHEWRPEATVA